MFICLQGERVTSVEIVPYVYLSQISGAACHERIKPQCLVGFHLQ